MTIDNIYCLDKKIDNIQTCTSDGGKVSIHSLALELACRGMAADVHQNLYMSDCENSCIQVFSNHLHSFGQDLEERSVTMVCVCVHGHYVYVTNIISHCASVFTTDGEHVSSFCQCGKKEGNFNLPFHIFIDNNSFGYVADLYNDRTQCFQVSSNIKA